MSVRKKSHTTRSTETSVDFAITNSRPGKKSQLMIDEVRTVVMPIITALATESATEETLHHST